MHSCGIMLESQDVRCWGGVVYDETGTQVTVDVFENPVFGREGPYREVRPRRLRPLPAGSRWCA